MKTDSLNKISRKVMRGVLPFILLGVMTACTSDSPVQEEPADPPGTDEPAEPSLVFATGTDLHLTIGNEATTLTVRFTATDDWTVTLTDSQADGWVSLSKESGPAGIASLDIVIDANETYDERSAGIVFTCGSSQTMEVTQRQLDALLIGQSRYEVQAAGGNMQVEVQANVAYEVDVADSWVHYVESRALETSQLLFEIDANQTAEERTATVVIRSEELTEEIQICQLPTETPEDEVLLLSTKVVEVSAKGETIGVQLQCNVAYDYFPLSTYDWIEDKVSRSVSEHTLYFAIKANDTYDAREAAYVFKSQTSELADTLTIHQLANYALILSDSRYALTSAEQNFQLHVKTNRSYDVETHADWIELIESRGLENAELTFRVTENTAENSREGTITVKCEDPALTQTVTVVQQGKEISDSSPSGGSIEGFEEETEEW